jgi:dTDP-4-amino-4,6-dideoxygalactose transaminase
MPSSSHSNNQTIPFLDLDAQYRNLKEEIQKGINRVLENKSFILGHEVLEFEKEFGAFSQTRNVIGVSNGTDALLLALDALGVGPGDEVITTPYTFISTAEVIVQRGAKPVFVDICQSDFNIDPEQIKPKISLKTKAIIAVHLYGQPARMKEICVLAKEKNIAVIEDSAQAHGAKIDGKPIGTFGDIATFSFYPGKNLGAYGDAGAVTSQNDELAHKMRLLRDHGRSEKYIHKIMGYNCRMDGIQAAILRAKLPHLKDWTRKRQENAQILREMLKGTNGLILPQHFPNAQSVIHLFVIRHKKRDSIQKFLEEKGITTLVHYPLGLHRQPCFKYLELNKNDFPNTEAVSQEVLSIPCYPELESQQLKYIATSLKQAIQNV